MTDQKETLYRFVKIEEAIELLIDRQEYVVKEKNDLYVARWWPSEQRFKHRGFVFTALDYVLLPVPCTEQKEISEEEIEQQITNVLFEIHSDFKQNSVSLSRHANLIKGLLPPPSSGSKIETVKLIEEFIKYCWDKGYEYNEGFWEKSGIFGTSQTTTELYELFLKDKQQ